MEHRLEQALQNAAASSAAEGLPVNNQQLEIITQILEGHITLQDYFEDLKLRCKVG